MGKRKKRKRKRKREKENRRPDDEKVGRNEG